MKNNVTQKMKLPAVPVPDMSNLTKEQLKAEIEKGFADTVAGRVTPAAEANWRLSRKVKGEQA